MTTNILRKRCLTPPCSGHTILQSVWLAKMGDQQMTKGLWTTRELAEAAASAGKPVTQEYIRQLCKRGIIPAMRPSRDWIIVDEDARVWLEGWLVGDKV